MKSVFIPLEVFIRKQLDEARRIGFIVTAFGIRKEFKKEPKN